MFEIPEWLKEKENSIIFHSKTNLEIDDYNLFDQSVAIDYCTVIPGLETDKEGVSRDSSPDAGALEYLP